MDAKTLCLGALTLGEASGYELKKLFEEGPFAHFHHTSFGSIYPALNVLCQQGAVTHTVQNQEGRPDKKVYRITEKGMQTLRAALHKDPAQDKVSSETVFILFFAELLDEGHLRRVYDGYLATFRERARFIRDLDSAGISEGRLFVRGLGLAFYEAMADYMEANRERLLDGAADEPAAEAGSG